jgi:hypothetical protein
MRGIIAHTFKLVWRFRQLEERALRGRRGAESKEWRIKGPSQQPHAFLGFDFQDKHATPNRSLIRRRSGAPKPRSLGSGIALGSVATTKAAGESCGRARAPPDRVGV